MSKPTQADRVLAAARSFQGTCQADWLAEHTPDGGPRITRVPARIDDLERRGAVFETIGWRAKTKVFRLVSAPDGIERRAPADPPRIPVQPELRTSLKTPDTLFDVGPQPHWKDAA